MIYNMINSEFTQEGIMDKDVKKRDSEEFANSVNELIAEICNISSTIDSYITNTFCEDL